MNEPEVRYGWHFLRDNGHSSEGRLGIIEVGKTYRVKPPIAVCERGLHGAADPLVALRYAPGALVEWCRYEGPFSDDDSDGKWAAASRTALAQADVTRELHLFAIGEARRALMRERKAGREPNPRSWEALRVKRRWLDGKATDAELSAARRAAWSVAWSAGWSAGWSVAESAAGSAAGSAAESAAESAAWSVAGSVAGSAGRKAQSRRLEHILRKAVGL